MVIEEAQATISHQAETEASTQTPRPQEAVSYNVELVDHTNLLPFRKVVIVFLGLSSCILVSTLDSTVVSTALPTITAFFHAGTISSWVPSATLLTSTAFQPIYGRLSDIFGRKATLTAAICLFMLGNLCAGFARNINQLIAFAAISGAGGGGIITVAQVVMSDVVSLRDRGKYQGIIGGFVALRYAIGPLIGGALAEKVTWRWCFWITLPLSAVSAGIILFVLPLKPVRGDLKDKLLSIDYMGTILTLGGCVLILLPLIWGGVTFPWVSGTVLGTLLGGIALVAIFCLWEWKGAKIPIVPMRIFRHATVCGVCITIFINGFIFWTSLFYLPQFFQTVVGYSPIRSGIFILPILIGQTVTSFLVGVLISKTGRYRAIVYSGFGLWAIGCGCLSTLNVKSSKAVQVVFMLLSGIGAGQTLQTTTVAVQASVARKDMSVVTAVRNFLRYVGGALSLAVASSIINNGLISRARSIGLPQSLLQEITADPTLLSKTQFNVTIKVRQQLLEGYNHGFRTLFILNASLAAFATTIAFVMIKHKELIRADDAQKMAESRKQEEIEMRAFTVQKSEGDSKEVATPRNDRPEITTRRIPPGEELEA
ncbi:hypothetical protein M422DRAFT_230422 [Sphaerobolus stellatus SS14]|uniref:Major facilitator superfamily (MFS) profile domain-containing protein n=1 Tax=Sphaerobolus stellatus (strain SS14) TaxID=990650 RepID=A0A0C9UYA7_SPHS4|nr:hypothetical protein M422DRAFT_230422 [Sphaerobolus stellatus SS14]